MSTYDWAEKECRIACKRENPEYDFDSDEFDYGCSCYKSALKAFKSLCEDEHSGASFSFTKNILIKLMNNHPLTPITDDDFFINKEKTTYCGTDESFKEQCIKGQIQCPRMSSLFRTEDYDGNVTYKDIDRAYCINIENPSDTYYSSGAKVVDELFPITMPYMPKKEPYKVYEQTFLVNKENGDFDVRGIIYVETPEGERIDINRYQREGCDHKWVDISKEEYEELLSRRIDPLNEKIAGRLLWTLISNSGTSKEIEAKENQYRRKTEFEKSNYFTDLCELCKFFNNPENYRYNTFEMHQALCENDKSKFNDVQELTKIAEYLDGIIKSLNVCDENSSEK